MKVKTVISIMIDGQQYFNLYPNMSYWTNDLKKAKIYNCRATSKVAFLKHWIRSYADDPESVTEPNVYLETNGEWTGYSEHILLTEKVIKTAKLYEVILDIREL